MRRNGAVNFLVMLAQNEDGNLKMHTQRNLLSWAVLKYKKNVNYGPDVESCEPCSLKRWGLAIYVLPQLFGCINFGYLEANGSNQFSSAKFCGLPSAMVLSCLLCLRETAVGVAKLLVRCVYGTLDTDALPTATARPCRLITPLVFLLLALETLSLCLALSRDSFYHPKSWGYVDVMLLILVIFLSTNTIGTFGLLLALCAGRLQSHQALSPSNFHRPDQGHPERINEMILMVSMYFSVIFFAFAAVIAVLGIWILFEKIPGLGLLGDIILVVAFLCLQGSVSLSLPEVSDQNQTLRERDDRGVVDTIVTDDPSCLLGHVKLRHDAGISVYPDDLDDLLQPRKMDAFLGLWLVVRICINFGNTVGKTVLGLLSLAGGQLGWLSNSQSAQQLVISFIEAVLVVQYMYEIRKWKVQMKKYSDSDPLLPQHPKRFLHDLHDNVRSIADYSLLRNINFLNLSKAVDLYERSKSKLQFLQAIVVYGLLAVVSLYFKVSAISQVLAKDITEWIFFDWMKFVAFVNNIAGITNFKLIERRAVDEFIFGDGRQIAGVRDLDLYTAWRSRLSLLILENNGQSILNSLLVINTWSNKKSQHFILDRHDPDWMRHLAADEQLTSNIPEESRATA